MWRRGPHAKVSQDHSHQTSLLSVLSKGVVAVLGPQSKANSDHIKSICDNTEVPFIETRPALTERHQLSSINLHPDPDKMGDILGTTTHFYPV